MKDQNICRSAGLCATAVTKPWLAPTEEGAELLVTSASAEHQCPSSFQGREPRPLLLEEGEHFTFENNSFFAMRTGLPLGEPSPLG